ncbi:MAG: hypothetical protein O7G87_00090 [bacterium]|nr:hypothetical protein [bacterium]
MSSQKITQILLVVVAILLLANLARPLLSPHPAFAQDDDEQHEDVEMVGSGSTAWILKGNNIYYIKWENQFESVRIYGPEELER